MKTKAEKKKNKKRLIAAAIIMCLLISLIFTSCKRIEDDEAKAIISNLLDRSYTLNQIYFGEGLSYNEDEEEITGYCMVSDDEPMNTKEAIVKETNIVFSEKIASHLIKTYFEGIESYKVAEYARYIETDIGKVLVRKKYTPDVKEVLRYDNSTIEITKNGKNEIEATVYTVDKSQKITIYIVYEGDSWKLDWYTY